jgi:hypothetical protein
MTTQVGKPDSQIHRAALELGVFGVVPVILTIWVVHIAYTHGTEAVDFTHSFWTAGWRTAHGFSPYAWTHAQISRGVSFPYPALTALLLAPLSLASRFTESIPITVIGVLAAPVALRVVGVRDWRVYGAVALSAPVVTAWQTANVTVAMLLALALLWRYRDRAWAAGLLLALMVAVKPIMAPLWLWLVFTRRWRAAAVAAIVGAGMTVGAFALIGWQQLTAWRHLIALQGRLMDTHGYSLISLATHLGWTRQAGILLMVGSAAALVVAAGASSRRRGDSRPFAAMVLMTLVVSPQVDGHYMALLFVPLALVRARLSWPWVLPLMLWICPVSEPILWQIVVWWAVGLSLACVPLLDERRVPGTASVPWRPVTHSAAGPRAVQILRAAAG